MTENAKKIENLLKARYDLIYIVTHEEERALKDIVDTASSMSLKTCSWTFSSGMKTFGQEIWINTKDKGNSEPVKEEYATGQPTKILSLVEELKNNCIIVLEDFHPYLKDAETTRKLKDVLEKVKPIYTPVIIISPILKIPVEIEKLVTVIEYSLPVKNEIAEIIDEAIETLDIPTISDKEKDNLIRACQGLTSREIENAIARSVAEKGTMDSFEILSEKKQIIKKSGVLEYFDTEDSMDDVGGMENLKDWLAKRKVALSEEAQVFGLPPPKGLLLLGIPGCGKSLIAKAVAKYWNMPLLRFDVGAVMQGLVGSSEENMRKVIQAAEASAPCVLWTDEIDKGFSGTSSSNFSDAGTTSRVFGSFITWLSEKKSSVFVVATANDVEQLPSELLRKGRFDEIFFADLPNYTERKEILSIHLRKLGRDPKNFNLEKLSETTEGFSGADIRESIISAMFDVFSERPDEDITHHDISKAASETVPLSKMMAPKIKKIREWCTGNRVRSASVKIGDKYGI